MAMAKMMAIMAMMSPQEKLVEMLKESCENYETSRLTDDKELEKKHYNRIIGISTMLILKESGNDLGGPEELINKMDQMKSETEFFDKIRKPEQN